METEEIDGYDYYVFDLGDLADKRARKKGLWRIARQANVRMVYYSCPYCNSIAFTDPRLVSKNGLSSNGACQTCGEAFRMKLLHWGEFLEELRKEKESGSK